MTTPKESYTGHCLCGALQAMRFDGRTGRTACVSLWHVPTPKRQLHRGHGGQPRPISRSRKSDTLKWYRSSDFAKRGFCSECGSALFWDDGGDQVSLNAGSLDQPTGLKLGAHIFVDDKPDYYEIEDDLPKHPAGSGVTLKRRIAKPVPRRRALSRR